ncbi:MarR family transcriptional regulator [Azorhizobium oxalatiphilum]|uniref:MarR family transcriptional regulator n=1 Tax=Azorhizobium oxalatiphilum TaxID=980631 RepID=A0A917BRI3_9HYPH|nr:MarR family winged helix-turn-helix transcriptional regulator [Azorhizobium oxalatiphilum]GGF54199.1 MarR family transcriptional regulator [Azorhizobium oxalatiphilum]
MSGPQKLDTLRRAKARRAETDDVPLRAKARRGKEGDLVVKMTGDEVTEPIEGLFSLWSRPGFLVRRLHQISVAIFMEGMAELEVTPLQFGALSIIAVSPGIEQAAVGTELGVDRANNGDVLNRLEKAGLIVRHTAPHDRRTRKVYLTVKGRDMVLVANERFATIQKRFLGPLTAAEKKVFLGLLSKLIEENNELGRTVLRFAER